MKRLIAILIMALFPSLVFAANENYSVEKWTVAWTAISTSTAGASPSSYTDGKGNAWSEGVYIRHASEVYVECSTATGSGTDTDFNFGYDNNDFSLWVFEDNVTNNKTYGKNVSTWGSFLILTADNDDSSNTITPSCTITVFFLKIK